MHVAGETDWTVPGTVSTGMYILYIEMWCSGTSAMDRLHVLALKRRTCMLHLTCLIFLFSPDQSFWKLLKLLAERAYPT